MIADRRVIKGRGAFVVQLKIRTESVDVSWWKVRTGQSVDMSKRRHGGKETRWRTFVHMER